VRILLIEDSSRLQRSLGDGLRRAGYALDVVGDGREGLRWALCGEYDVIVLDLMLPGQDGLSVLNRLRETGNRAHVLILTAKDTVDDRVRGLRAGADDYLVKPFAFDELLARIQALVRRRHGTKSPCIRVGSLAIDTAASMVSVAGDEVSLTPREYALLEYLVYRRGTVVSRADIERHIYADDGGVFSNVVDSAVCALRRKIDRADAPSLIQTRRGLGYILGAGEA
jgi:DNA-binding response OmpR family regulator